MGSGILRFPIFCDEGLDKFCRWHLTDLHTTDQCQIFKNLLIKQVARGTVALTREQTSAMGLSDFLIPERKRKQAMSVDQWNATEGMMKSCSESSRANETGMTYKQVLQSPPGMTRLVENLQVLRHRMCESCSNLLHAELVDSGAIKLSSARQDAAQRLVPKQPVLSLGCSRGASRAEDLH